jgi:hypothetical protein
VITGAAIGYAVSEFLVDRHTCEDGSGGDASSPTVALTFRF